MCITGQVDLGPLLRIQGMNFAFPAGEASGNSKIVSPSTKVYSHNGIGHGHKAEVLILRAAHSRCKRAAEQRRAHRVLSCTPSSKAVKRGLQWKKSEERLPLEELVPGRGTRCFLEYSMSCSGHQVVLLEFVCFSNAGCS